MNNKPLVAYKAIYEDCHLCVGGGAILLPVDHPGHSGRVTNTKWIFTSPIVKYTPETGLIETENTIYYPRGAVS